MAFTTDDFNKVWASTSPLTPYEFSESNYKQGWNFVGGTPPARQMWDSIQKKNDEKAGWLYTAHNELVNLLKTLIPTGCVQAFAGNATPAGWLLCDGSAVSRTQYSRLFGVIGTTYGAGDGTDTFNLPNLIDKFVQGNAVAGTEHSAGLPNITGDVGVRVYGDDSDSMLVSPSGAIEIKSKSDRNSGPGGEGAVSSNIPTLSFDASKSNSIYGNSATVQPPAVTMRYIIKY